MTEQLVRGYMIYATEAYLQKTYDSTTRAKMNEGISQTSLEIVRNVDNITWYPIVHLCEMFREIAMHHQRTDGKVREALTSVGCNIAEMAQNSFLKLVMKVLAMAPSLFQAKLPGLWQRDHKFGRLTAPVFDTTKKVMETTLTDIKGYDYIAPVGAGYLVFAIERVFQFQNPRVNYDWEVENPGPNTINYTVTWD